MHEQRNFCIDKNQPIVICFVQEDDRQKFLKTHRAESGFFAEKWQTEGYVFYKLYTSGYVFNAKVYEDSYRGHLGFFVSTSGERMTQNQTIRSLTKCVHIFGLKDQYIIHSNSRAITRDMSNRGAEKLLQLLEKNRIAPKPETDREKVVEDKGQRRKRKEDLYIAANDFYTVQGALLEAERAYRKDHFFSFSYSSVSTVAQVHDEGTVYSFKIAQALSDSLQKKLKPNTAVNIVQDQTRPIRATVVKFNARNNTIYMKVRVAELSEIPTAAMIVERENVSYPKIANALGSMKNHTAQNGFMEALLFEGEIPPIEIKKRFKSEKFNKKQIEAIEKAINTEDFLLVQGPPGTGKTQIIIEMVKHFVENGQRVLICSQNNHAVDNVLAKCRSLHFATEQKQPIHCLRIGTAESVEAELRNNLLRPLTETIQHDMQKRSREACTAYEQRLMDTVAKADGFTRFSDELINLLEQYGKAHNLCLQLRKCFERSALEIIYTPTFLKELRERAERTLRITTNAANIIASLLNNEKPEDYLKSLQMIQEELPRQVRDIGTALSKKSFLKSIYIDIDRAGSVFQELAVVVENSPATMEIISKLENYDGNSVAEFLPAVGLIRNEDQFCFDRDEYTHKLTDVVGYIKTECAQMRTDLQRWTDLLQNDNKSVGEALLRSIKIVGATCIGSSTRAVFNDLEYDVAIVDEAGQIPLHNLLVPLVKVKKFILVGDHIQLPPMEEGELKKHLENTLVPRLTEELEPEDPQKLFSPFESVGECYSKSLFEVLYGRKDWEYLSNHTVMLTEQYRCHPQIAEFVSKQFYGGLYTSGVAEEDRRIDIAGFNKPLCLIDTVHIPDKQEKSKLGSTSYYNDVEAEICAQKVCDIVMQIRKDPEKHKNLIDKQGNYEIGVISGYGDQVELLDETIRKRLVAELGDSPAAADEANLILSRISIDTLDSFQGMEKQIIIFSCVRSNPDARVGFLNDTRRINVLMTRAKSLLIVVGDSQTLQNTKAVAKHDGRPVAEILEEYVKICKTEQQYEAPESICRTDKEGSK